MNPLVKGTQNVSSGNCKLDLSTNNRGALGSFEIPLTGKWYFECFAQMGSALEGYVGIADMETDLQSSRGGITDSSFEGFGFSQYTGSNYFSIKVDSGTADNAGRIDEGTTNNAVLGIAVNRDDDEIKLYTNNSLKFTLSISATTQYFPIFGVGGGSNSSIFMYLNAGQDSSFGGNKTAGGNADGNGFGDFFYSPPSNHLALCSANLPVATSIDPAETDDNHPTKNFNALIYSGDGTSSNAITGLGFRPDLTWIKERNGTNLYSHSMTDSSRGRARMIFAEHNREEDGSTSTQDLVSFDSDGFTVGSNQETNSNGSTGTFISWCWRANAGTTATNTSGTITSTVQANQDLGFSIVTWTGTGTNSTVGHGLSAAPDCILIKNRTDDTSSDGDASGRNWVIFNSALGSSDILSLNQTNNKDTGTGYLNGTDPTSTVFSVGESVDTNESSHAMIAYCWHNIVGYQKFDTYTGNGNADGPYVYLGFRPRLVITKMTNGSYSEHWNMWDSVDDTKGDPCGNDIEELHRITEATEATSSTIDINFFSNGFKITGSNTEQNENAKTIAYFAWADVPFKYGNAF